MTALTLVAITNIPSSFAVYFFFKALQGTLDEEETVRKKWLPLTVISAIVQLAAWWLLFAFVIN